MFRFHASGDFRDVRNKFGAQPHGVGRAGLLDVRIGLGARPLKSIERCAGQQRQQTDKTHDPYGHFPPRVRESHLRGEDSGAWRRLTAVSQLACRPSAPAPDARPKVAKVRSQTQPSLGTRRVPTQANRMRNRPAAFTARRQFTASAGLVLAPGEAAAGTAELSSDDIVRARRDGAFVHFRRRIVKRQVTAKHAIGHRQHDIANCDGITCGYCHAQQRIDGGMTANQQRRGKKPKKQRGDNDGPRRGGVIRPTRALPPAQTGADRIRLDEPCGSVGARTVGCVHCAYKTPEPLNGR